MFICLLSNVLVLYALIKHLNYHPYYSDIRVLLLGHICNEMVSMTIFCTPSHLCCNSNSPLFRMVFQFFQEAKEEQARLLVSLFCI